MDCRLWLVLVSATTAMVYASPVAWNKEITVSINTARWVQLVHDKFLSFTLRPETIMKTEHFSNETLTMMKGLSPAFVRIGGPETNTMSFMSNDSSTVTITGEQWSRLYQFMSDADMDVIVCLNNNHRVGNIWDSRNALELITFSDKHGFNNVMWQLGYESQRLNWYPSYRSGKELGRDVVRLRKMLDGIPRYQKSFIIGPGALSLSTTEDVRFMEEYITEAGDALNALTWHQHFQNENASVNNEGTRDAQVLIKIMQNLDTRVWPRSEKKPVWIAEDSPSGETFSDALAWIGRLGTAARLGFQVIMRQPSSEALHHQTPVYWASLLYRNLVGKAVLDTKMTSADHPMMQVFSHCTAVYAQVPANYIIDTEQPYRPGTVTIFGSNSANENVRVKLRGSYKEEEVHVYILTAESNKSRNHMMTTLMNDKHLILSTEGKLPMVTPEVQYPDRNVAVTVPARSVFFIVLPTLQARTCMQYPATTVMIERLTMPRRVRISPKITDTGIESKIENNFLDADNSANNIKHNIKENKNRLLERSVTTVRDRIIIPRRLRMSKQPRIRNKISETLKKKNRDYTKYITFSDNAWLSKFPVTNDSQEITEEMMKQFEETVQKADNNHQVALESIRNLNKTERRKLYLTLTQAIIGKRKASDENTDDGRDNTDNSIADTSNDDTSHTRNKQNYNIMTTTGEDTSENKITEDVTDDVSRVKRFIEGESTTEMKSQLHLMQNMERPKPDIKSKSDKIILNRNNTQSATTPLNIQNQIQQNGSSHENVRTEGDQNIAGEDYLEEVKMLMESVLDEDSTDSTKHDISPRQLTQFSTDLAKRNDLLFKDDMTGLQELLEAELTPLEKANQTHISEKEKGNFSVQNNSDETNNDVENMRRKREPHNETLTTSQINKEAMVNNESQKSNTGKESGMRHIPMFTKVLSRSLKLTGNNDDKILEDKINTVNRENNIQKKVREPGKNNLTASLFKMLSNETFEEKNRQIYLYLKELAEEGERVIKSLYKEIEETNNDNNNDGQAKISVTESDTPKRNINNVLTLPNFSDTDFIESLTDSKNTTKRDTYIKPVNASVSDATGNVENESMKSLYPGESRTENKIKISSTDNLEPEVQLDMKSEKEKLTEAVMPDNVTNPLSSSSLSKFQQGANDQEYVSLTSSDTNDKNTNKLYNLNSTTNKHDTEMLYEEFNKEMSNAKSDTSESNKHKIVYSSEENEQKHNKTVKEAEVRELKATETNKEITKEENYNDYHEKDNVSETPSKSLITTNTDEVIKRRNDTNNNQFIKKENAGNEKLGVIMKINNKSERRIIGKRDKADIIETDTYEENRSSGENKENTTKLDPLKQSSDVRDEEQHTVDKAIRKRDDSSMMEEKQSSKNNDTSLDPVTQRADNQQKDSSVSNTQNNDLHNIIKKSELSNDVNQHNNSETSVVPVNNISNMLMVSENKTLNNSNTNISATNGNTSAIVSEVTLPLQDNKQPIRDSEFVYQQRKNRMEAFKKRLAETRERLLNRFGANNNLNKRDILIKQKRDTDNFSSSEYILTPLSKYIGLNEEDFIPDSHVVRDQNNQWLLKSANNDEETNTGYKESVKGVDNIGDRNRMNYLLNQDDRHIDNFQTSKSDNNLPMYRLIRLLKNSRQQQEQEFNCKNLCRDNSRHTPAPDRALLVPIEDVRTPTMSDDMALEDTNVYTMIPAIMNGRRFLRSTGDLLDKTDGDYFRVQRGKIEKSKFEVTEDSVHGDKITESNKNLHITDINNDKKLESRNTRKVIPVLLLEPNDYRENCDNNKNIRSKRSITCIHSVEGNEGLKQRSQNKINFHMSSIEMQSAGSNGAGNHKHDVSVRPSKLSSYNVMSNGLLSKPKILKRSINDPQLNMKNSMKTLLSMNHISNESTSLGESEEDDDSLFDSMLHRTFIKAMIQKKSNGRNLPRLYNLAKEYQKRKPKDNSIETEASLKRRKQGGNEFHKLKFRWNNNNMGNKTKNKTGIDNIQIQERKTDKLSVKRNQLLDTNETARARNNTSKIEVMQSTDLVMYLIERIHKLFRFLNILTAV